MCVHVHTVQHSFSQSSTSSSQSNDTLSRQRAMSLLDRLRPPRKSDLDRKRRTVTNPPPRGKCK